MSAGTIIWSMSCKSASRHWSSIIRARGGYRPGCAAERENCCDDVAVELCGSRGAYVGALLALEQQRANSPLALAASGGSLVARARRLISPTASETGLGWASAWLAGMLPMGAVALLLILGTTFAADSEPRVAGPAAAQAGKDAGTEPESAGGEPAPANREPSDQAGSKPAQPKSTAGAAKAEAGGTPVATEADDPKIAFEVAVEDGATAKLKIVLLDPYSRPIKTWENVEPGAVRLDLPDVEDDRYRLEVSAEGFSTPWATLVISREGIDVRPKRLELNRRRYAVLRYAVNMSGKQDLEGPGVKEGRVAVLSGQVPDLRGDWAIVQQKGVPTFRLHMVGVDNGFVPAPPNATFEDIKRAPDPDQFQPDQFVPAEKGAILFNRILGNGPNGRKYAKILIEDITETRPADIEIINSAASQRNVAADRAKRNEQSPGKPAGGQATVKAPPPARLASKPAKRTEQPLGKAAIGQGRRYAVLRYAVNLSGKQDLEGPDVKEGRVAIASGQVPDLPNDWIVIQDNGVPTFRHHRMGADNGFALVPAKATFEEIKRAPDPDQYRRELNIPAEKGMILFNHILGNTNDPKGQRYAKILIEDITETPPPDTQVIDSSPSPANSAGKLANNNEQPPGKAAGGEGRRYVVLRYAMNLFGKQDLEGLGVKQGRVAIASGNVPDLRGDWTIVQGTGGPMFQHHRTGTNNGFALAPPNTTFEAIKRAPDPDQYQPDQYVAAEKGMILFDRILGNDGKGRYAKILIEDITETPPADIEAIDTFPSQVNSTASPTNINEPPPGNAASGELTVTVGLEDGALAPVRLELRAMSRKLPLKVWDGEKPGTIRVQLPQLQQGLHVLITSSEGYGSVRTLFQVSGAGPNPAEVSIKLFRIRYAVLRYAMNTKGGHNLTGENVEEGRVGIVVGSVPQLRDWIVDQIEGKPTLKIMRITPNTGFALAHQGDKFEDLDRAPANEDYTPAGLPLEEGMILFNRVMGSRPEDARYAKLLVEEITEKRPENLQIINSPGWVGLGM